MVDPSDRPKPAYYAWRTLDRLVAGLPYAGSEAASLKLPSDGYALRFASRTRSVTVLWLAPETMYSDQGLLPAAEQTASITTPSGTVEIVDMTGARAPVGRTFQASPYPVYLIAVRTGSGTRRRPRRLPSRHRRPRPLQFTG